MKKLLSLLLAAAVMLCLASCSIGIQEVPAPTEETEPVAEQPGYYVFLGNDHTRYLVNVGLLKVNATGQLGVTTLDGRKLYFSSDVRPTGTEPGEKYLGAMTGPDHITIDYFRDDNGYSYMKTVTKTRSSYGSDGNLIWKMTLTASFKYDGSSAECVHVEGSTYIAQTGSWTLVSESPVADESTASYTASFARDILGIVTSCPSYTISFSCTPDGVIS